MAETKPDLISQTIAFVQSVTMGNVVTPRTLANMDILTRTLVAFTSADVSNVRLIMAAGTELNGKLYHNFLHTGYQGFKPALDPETGRLVFEVPILHTVFLDEGPRMENNHWCLGKSITGIGQAKVHPFDLLRVRYDLVGLPMELLINGYPDARVKDGNVLCLESLAEMASAVAQRENASAIH